MAKSLFDLKGKVTVVTGGNSGIGLGFARGIAKQGGDLAIWARSKERNAAAQKELESFGVRVTTRQVDVTSEQEVATAFDALIAEMGRVDCVFANSGMGPLPNRLDFRSAHRGVSQAHQSQPAWRLLHPARRCEAHGQPREGR